MPTPRARILFDAFHHMLPGHRVGRQIATGGYAANFGRYSPGDCYHPNGLAHLEAALSPEFDLRLLTEPYSDVSLHAADILLVANPDYPLYEGASPYRWTPEDVDALLRFLSRGGGCLLCVNSFLSRPDYWEENFDLERVNLLFERLGVRWDPNYMSDDRQIEHARSGRFRLGYGQGGRVLEARLPNGVHPLITYGENIYGFRTRIGHGQLAVIGDTGLISNGLVCFPGFDNLEFLLHLFRELRPAWLTGGQSHWQRVGSLCISCAPSPDGLNEAVLRSLRPQAHWLEDYHYRHLVWDLPESAGDASIWTTCPVDLASLPQSGTHRATLPYMQLDSDEAGAACEIHLHVHRTESADGADLHALGRRIVENVPWHHVCKRPATLADLGTLERVAFTFHLRAVLDAAGKPRCARWGMGQMLYVRSERSAHYGYEIPRISCAAAILPVATP